jgi:ATP-dependent DNA ligase
LSRSLSDATAHYPSITSAITHARADAVLLDGEAVALDDRGRGVRRDVQSP